MSTSTSVVLTLDCSRLPVLTVAASSRGSTPPPSTRNRPSSPLAIGLPRQPASSCPYAEECCQLVCATDSFCCSVAWDCICTSEAGDLCGDDDCNDNGINDVDEINAGLADPKLMARFAELGAAAFIGSASDFGTFIGAETEKWGRVVKFAAIKPE